jgi:hypothetical protein
VSQVGLSLASVASLRISIKYSSAGRTQPISYDVGLEVNKRMISF